MENTLKVDIETRDMKKAAALYVKYAECLKEKKRKNRQRTNKETKNGV